MLEVEIKFFSENLPDWLQKHADRVALIKGATLIGFFDNEQQAISEGARLFGLESFLVRRVTADEPSFSAPAMTMGILSASNPSPCDSSSANF
jgi:hypothetical protein